MAVTTLWRILFPIGMILFGTTFGYAAEKMTVAVASNFMRPFEELSRIFTEGTGLQVARTFASTGKLYAQIREGAPYDLFLAADEVRPKRLFADGLVERPFVYARGRVVLWTANKDLCDAGGWKEVLVSPEVRKIAIANPETAPYGAVPMRVLKEAGLLGRVRERLVFAQTVSQAFQYAHSEATQAGFCALSSALSVLGKRGCYLAVTEARPVVQEACILKRAVNREAARRFGAFLGTPMTEAVKRKYGYE